MGLYTSPLSDIYSIIYALLIVIKELLGGIPTYNPFSSEFEGLLGHQDGTIDIP